MLSSDYLSAQKDSLLSKFSFEADFRFRLEQDWDSRRPDGTYRDDRSRMRYRARAGVNYQHNDWASFGLRLRTGNPNKQQDPQVTLGNQNQESGTLPLSFEIAFFQAKKDNWSLWMGKNTFPFRKNNELFWSDNVFPDGIFFKRSLEFESEIIQRIELGTGHFILNATGSSFGNDGYFQGLQINSDWWKEKFSLFPSFYIFNRMPNIPDGGQSFFIDYSIAHIGTKLELSNQPNIQFEFDYYVNLEDYDNEDSISASLRDEKEGWTAALSYGQEKQKGDWLFKLTYTYLERFSAVDFLTQNDWARWDYSSFNSPDGRLTNLQGFEMVAIYSLDKNIRLTTKYYWIDQLIPNGIVKESNQRIRFDLDISFNRPRKKSK